MPFDLLCRSGLSLTNFKSKKNNITELLEQQKLKNKGKSGSSGSGRG